MKIRISVISCPIGQREYSFINDAEHTVICSSIEEVKKFYQAHKDEVGKTRGGELFFDWFPEEATDKECHSIDQILGL